MILAGVSTLRLPGRLTPPEVSRVLIGSSGCSCEEQAASAKAAAANAVNVKVRYADMCGLLINAG